MLIHVIVFICNTRRHNLKFSFNVTWFWIICLFVWVLDHCTCVWLVWHFILGKRSLVCIAATASCGHSLCMEVRWCGFLMAWGIDRFRIRWYLGVVWLSSVQCTMLWLSDSVFKWTLIVPKSFMKVSSANSTDPWGIFALKFWMNSVEFCSSRLFLAFVVCDTKGVRCTVRNVNECSDAVWVMWMTGIMCCEKWEWLSLCGVRKVNDCDDVVWEMWMIVMTWCEKCDWLWWCVVRNVIDWMVWEMYDCNCLNC